MWAALGELTKDPAHYEHALELSNGRFFAAYCCLGQHYFDKGDLRKVSENYMKAVKVVQQEPEEGNVWANVAAVHMHNKNPSEP
eukprot:1136131-Ditylum_brightwellii.AAC.1